MLEKYNVNNVDKWNIDDFRNSMQIIVKKGDDALFDKYLSKKSDPISPQMKEPKDKKKHVNSLYLDQSCGFESRTMPQVIKPKGFFSQSVETSQERMSP